MCSSTPHRYHYNWSCRVVGVRARHSCRESLQARVMQPLRRSCPAQLRLRRITRLLADKAWTRLCRPSWCGLCFRKLHTPQPRLTRACSVRPCMPLQCHACRNLTEENTACTDGCSVVHWWHNDEISIDKGLPTACGMVTCSSLSATQVQVIVLVRPCHKVCNSRTATSAAGATEKTSIAGTSAQLVLC